MDIYLKLLSFFLLGKVTKNKNRSFITFKKISYNEIHSLKEEIMKNKIFVTQKDEGHYLKYLPNGSIDFEYYNKINATKQD